MAEFKQLLLEKAFGFRKSVKYIPSVIFISGIMFSFCISALFFRYFEKILILIYLKTLIFKLFSDQNICSEIYY